MGKTLVVVESPKKIETISKYLGKNYIVKASFGHIMDIKKGAIPNKENGYKLDYDILKEKSKIVKELSSVYKICDNVLLATDLDREGENIAYCVARLLKLKDPQRIIFNSITKNAILQAVANPKKINYNLVDAQKTRRLLDRLVGFKLSPLLWRSISPGLSAGRVQSPVLKLIVEREQEITNFESNKYFKFKGNFGELEDLTMYNLLEIGNILKGEITKIQDNKQVIQKLKDLDTNYIVHNIFNSKTERKPTAPYITSTLLQDSNSKYSFSSKKTMSLAQKLYEQGHITYMRTDSVTLSEEAMSNIKSYIIEVFGVDYYKGKQYKNKGNNTQEAHEAIRPTKIKKLKVSNDENQQKLYNLIWRKTVASQMTSAIIGITTIQIKSEINNYFEKSFRKILFDGYLKVYNDHIDDEEIPELPKINTKIEMKFIIAKEEFTKTIPRFSEGSLNKKLKDLGIGRPSTYSNMISLLLERGYVEKKNISSEEREIQIIQLKKHKIRSTNSKIKVGSEKNKIVPTEIGIKIIKYLNDNFKEIMDYKFTARFEMSLDKIAIGKRKMLQVLSKFDDNFSPKIDELTKSLPKIEPKKGKLIGDNIYVDKTKYGSVVYTKIDGKTKYVNIPKPLTINNIKLEEAIDLLKYPMILGKHNDKPVILHLGKHGMYVECGESKCSLKNNFRDIPSLETVIQELSNKQSLKKFEDKGKIYEVRKGPYGYYLMIRSGKKIENKNIPKNTNIENLTLQDIIEISKIKKKKYIKKK